MAANFPWKHVNELLIMTVKCVHKRRVNKISRILGLFYVSFCNKSPLCVRLSVKKRTISTQPGTFTKDFL